MSPYAQFQNIPTEFNNYYRVIDPITGQKATSLARLKELNPNENDRLWSLSLNNATSGFYPSSYYVEDGSYLRIAQVTLGYTFPKAWITKISLSQLRAFVSVENLATLSSLPKGIDPETLKWDYPAFRTVTFGLNLTL